MKLVRLLVVVLFFSSIALSSYLYFSGDTIYITSGLMGVNLGEKKNHHTYGIYGKHLPTIFKEYGISVKTPTTLKKLKNARNIVIFDNCPTPNIKHFKYLPKSKSVLFLWEPPSVIPENYSKTLHSYFGKVYTWDDDLVDNKKYFKFYYPEFQPMCDNEIPFNDKKLCTQISRNKTSTHPNELYSKRKEVVQFYEDKNTDDFDFYGSGWPDNCYKNYKGRLDSKECLKGYKFTYCYENITNINGYVTEKIFDSFHYGCVPIYLGANNIEKYIPKNCFIDRRDFDSDETLYCHLKDMSEEKHNEYINNIKIFLNSDKAYLFTSDHFLEIFKEAVGVKNKS
jgi:alpha(1,3/1,4) fucosyltransferase